MFHVEHFSCVRLPSRLSSIETGIERPFTCGHELKGPSDSFDQPTSKNAVRQSSLRSVLMFHVEHSGETHRRMEQVTIPPSRPSGRDLSQTSGAGSIGREEGGADGSPPDPSSCSTWNTQTKLRNGGSTRPIRQAIRMFHVEHQTFPPLVASSFSTRSFTLLRTGAFYPGGRKSERPLSG